MVRQYSTYSAYGCTVSTVVSQLNKCRMFTTTLSIKRILKENRRKNHRQFVGTERPTAHSARHPANQLCGFWFRWRGVNWAPHMWVLMVLMVLMVPISWFMAIMVRSVDSWLVISYLVEELYPHCFAKSCCVSAFLHSADQVAVYIRHGAVLYLH